MGKGKGMYLGVKTMERLADVMGGFDSVVSCKTSFFFFCNMYVEKIYGENWYESYERMDTYRSHSLVGSLHEVPAT